jgi:hypothetical protein
MVAVGSSVGTAYVGQGVLVGATTRVVCATLRLAYVGCGVRVAGVTCGWRAASCVKAVLKTR